MSSGGVETTAAQEFVRFSRNTLLSELWPRLGTCLDSLSEEPDPGNGSLRTGLIAEVDAERN